MGLFDFWKDETPDRANGKTRLIEISNDDGDHWVAELPAKGIKQTTDALKNADVVSDTDEDDYRVYCTQSASNKRDSSEYRFKKAPVFDKNIDLEPDDDYDDSDYEETHVTNTDHTWWR